MTAARGTHVRGTPLEGWLCTAQGEALFGRVRWEAGQRPGVAQEPLCQPGHKQETEIKAACFYNREDARARLVNEVTAEAKQKSKVSRRQHLGSSGPPKLGGRKINGETEITQT